MATINDCFNLLKYRGSQNSYLANLSPNDFNILWPRAEQRWFNALYAEYGATKRINDSLSKVKSDPTTITIDGAGKYTFPADMLHEATIINAVNNDVQQVQESTLGNKLSSSYDPPTLEYPIYVRYKTYLQFYPVSLGTATLTYLRKPTASFWNYTLAGTISTLGTITPGTGYGNGSYVNVPLTGGSGNSALANITVAGGVITGVIIVSGGVSYKVGDALSASNSFLGGAGTGFSIPVSAISNGRPVYDPTGSVDPVWLDTDIDQIVYLILQDFGISTRDAEVEQFAVNQEKMNS